MPQLAGKGANDIFELPRNDLFIQAGDLYRLTPLAGQVDHLFDRNDRFALCPDIEIFFIEPVVDILFKGEHRILQQACLYNLSLGFVHIVVFRYQQQVILQEKPLRFRLRNHQLTGEISGQQDDRVQQNGTQ